MQRVNQHTLEAKAAPITLYKSM